MRGHHPTLLVGNRQAGTGLEAGLLQRLAGILDADLEIVAGHPEARQATSDWLATKPKPPPAAVIAGGGGGTLRALAEAVCEGSGQRHIRIGGLRLGSGNVIPKRYGIPRDAIAAAHQIKACLDAGSTHPCAVIQCQFGEANPRYGITMCGLGHFGRTSGDLVRFHERAGNLRRAAARVIPLERINDAEYLSSFLARMTVAALVPTSCELVSTDRRRFRLLAGVVLTRRDQDSLPYYLVPRYGRPITGTLNKGESLTLTLEDRRHTEFFLDEDPEQATRAITITAAGTLDFVA